MKTIISTHTLGFSVPDRTLFSGVSCSVKEGERIALVGKNGTGKSTLLKILAGIVEPTEGSVTHARVHYMPQIDLSLMTQPKTVDEYVHERGVALPLVVAELHKLFDTTFKVEQLINSLSGGELMRLNLAIGVVHNPELLLLDEPTNHLDHTGLRVLERFLRRYSGACVIVSHDPLFLDRVASRVWALEDESLNEYGGTYSDYQEALRLKEITRLRAIEDARKALRKQRHALEKTETRYARGEREQRRIRADDAKDKFAKGAAKDSSQKNAGKWRVRLKEEIGGTKDALENLSVTKRTVHLTLDEDDAHGHTVLTLQNATLSVRERILAKDLNLDVRHGDRVALMGKNGTGKSVLIQALIGTGPAILSGTKKMGARNYVYVDQKYAGVSPLLSVLEHVTTTHPALDRQEVRNHLAKYMFGTTQEVKKLGCVLSGGEAARLTLAMVTAEPIDLLILDEPTNNLDLETLDIIANALKDFRGALIVISHNVHFLERLGIDRAYRLTTDGLKLMMTTPQSPTDFYNELVNTV